MNTKMRMIYCQCGHLAGSEYLHSRHIVYSDSDIVHAIIQRDEWLELIHKRAQLAKANTAALDAFKRGES